MFLYGCSIKETLWASGSDVNTVGLKEDPGYRVGCQCVRTKMFNLKYYVVLLEQYDGTFSQMISVVF